MKTAHTLAAQLEGLRPAAVLESIDKGQPDLQNDPLGQLLWETAWFAAGEGHEQKDRRERVSNVLRMLRRVAADQEVELAWQRCPAGVVRLLVHTVAHFPASLDAGGIVDTYDCFHGRADAAPEDRVVRPPRLAVE